MERRLTALIRFIRGSNTCLTRLKDLQVMKHAMRDPKWAISSARGWWRIGGIGLNRIEFVARLLSVTIESVESMFNELRSNDALYQHLRECSHTAGVPSGQTIGSMGYDVGEVLYLLVRLLKPEVVIETGVAKGISSFFVLQAEEDNRKGELYSIDLPATGNRLADGLAYFIPEGEQTGWVVPENLRHRWHLILGDAKEKLPFLLKQLGKIDIFLHDSLHTVEHQKWEYETAWPYIKEGGILLSDDIGRAFIEFCDKHRAPYFHYKYLGGINKGGGG